MAQAVTPSASVTDLANLTAGATKEQFGKIGDLLGHALGKLGILKVPLQRILENAHQSSTMIAELSEVVWRYVDTMSSLIVVKVSINRERKPREVFKATCRKLYLNDRVVADMPRCPDDEAELILFKPDLSARGGYITDVDLKKEFEMRGLLPAHPDAVASMNEINPALADKRPNATHWKNGEGKYCSATFSRWGVGRDVEVDLHRERWDSRWWFVGVRK